MELDKNFYKPLDNYDYLVVRSEQDLLWVLEDLKQVINSRSEVIEVFANDIEKMEQGRAEIVGTNLKTLVDTLISISHILPDEIEKIVEQETFDLDIVLTNNRKSHTQLLGILRATHVEAEALGLQKWSDGREKWRMIRHNKAINDFLNDIKSPHYNMPDDREQYMQHVQEKQKSRYEERKSLLQFLSSLNTENITSNKVTSYIDKCRDINEEEIQSIQQCYDTLQQLRSRVKKECEDRVENLRKELHTFGALHPEPHFKSITDIFDEAIKNVDLSELWRLGGGLKNEFIYFCNDMLSTDIVYEPFVTAVGERLEFLCSGFELKKILEVKGKLSQVITNTHMNNYTNSNTNNFIA